MCSICVAVGPCFFLSCPVTVEEFRTWFIDLWNHSIIPYLQEGSKDGIKVGQSIPNLEINLTCRSECRFLTVQVNCRFTGRSLCGRIQWSGSEDLCPGRLLSKTRPNSSTCLPRAQAPAAPASQETIGHIRRRRPAPSSQIHWSVCGLGL